MKPISLAMWSGPRNVSTALMRSWERYPKSRVHDEPFYAYYLAQSPFQEDHPGADEIIATYETDWREITTQLTAPLPDGIDLYYQKHMTHHILDEIGLDWLLPLSNCFLIREPRFVLQSLSKVIPKPHIDQTGFPQQIRIFEHIRQETGHIPPVISSKSLLQNPRRTLSRLCEALDIPFSDTMLAWPAGKRATDGIWAKYWYASVEQSTQFTPYRESEVTLPDHLHDLCAVCEALYNKIAPYELD